MDLPQKKDASQHIYKEADSQQQPKNIDQHNGITPSPAPHQQENPSPPPEPNSDGYETKQPYLDPFQSSHNDITAGMVTEEEDVSYGEPRADKFPKEDYQLMKKIVLDDVANQDATIAQRRVKWLPHLTQWSDRDIDIMALLQSVMFQANESVRQDVIRVARRMEYFNLLRAEIRKELQTAQKHLSRDVEQQLQNQKSPDNDSSNATETKANKVSAANTTKDDQDKGKQDKQKHPDTSSNHPEKNEQKTGEPSEEDKLKEAQKLHTPYRRKYFTTKIDSIEPNNRTHSFSQPGEEYSFRPSLEAYVKELEQLLNTVGDDAQLTYLDLQMKSQQQQQQLSLISNTSKSIHELHMSIIRKIGN